MTDTLRVILSDQLSHSISSLSDYKKDDQILMMELSNEVNYVNHHKKKIVLLFSAMRHFAKELEKTLPIDYVTIDDEKNSGNLHSEIIKGEKKFAPKKIVITEPGEYRILEELKILKKKMKIPIEIKEDTRFYCTIKEFEKWSKNRKQLRLEDFYRNMRLKHSILVENKKPIGGKWNYDFLNRKTAKKNVKFKEPVHHEPDSITLSVIKSVNNRFGEHFGKIEPFWYAVNQNQAKKSFSDFLKNRLEKFGDYQDAMNSDSRFLFHSVISMYLNCGLLEPRFVINKIISEYERKKIPLNSAEGYIRQILGWREFVRGIYWTKMPKYAKTNFFNAKKNLPKFYWDAKTDLNCIHHCVNQIIEEGYAHHIQRLMILGNFAMICGVSPKQVCDWYLSVFVDAFEWVEMPNTHGMALFADGGIIGSKPYAASGNYINKMSNYCIDCKYDVNKKQGKDACPFNYLYWNFFMKNNKKIKDNSRLWMAYSSLSKMDSTRKNTIKKDSQDFLKKI